MERVYGSRYVEGSDITEIAKEIRKDIAHAVGSGNLPDVKYSVRTKRYSGGQSIYVTAEHPSWSFSLSYDNSERNRCRKLINGFAAAYNYDGSDIQSDHFDTGFHFDVHLSSPPQKKRK